MARATFSQRVKKAVQALLGRDMLALQLNTTDVLPRADSQKLLKLYREHGWFKSIVDRIAFTTARSGWRLYQGKAGVRVFRGAREVRAAKAKGDLTEVLEHPALDLLRRPCPAFQGIESRKLLRVYRLVNGESIQIRERNRGKMTVQLWPVPSHWVKGVPSFADPAFRIQHGLYNKTLAPSEVIWARDLNAESPYGRGAGIGTAIQDDLDGDKYAAQLFASQLANRNMPDAIISIRDADGERIGRDRVEETEQLWTRDHNPITGKGKRLRFTGGQIDVKPLGTSFHEGQVQEMRTLSRRAMLEDLGMPPEVMGVVENSNRATSYVSRSIFVDFLIEPMLDEDCELYQAEIVDEWGDGLMLSYDSPRPEDIDLIAQLMSEHSESFLVDDIRTFGGLPVLEGNRGQVFAVKPGVQIVSDYSALAQKPAPQETNPAKRGDPEWVKDARRIG
jgi:hypothetical protein